MELCTSCACAVQDLVGSILLRQGAALRLCVASPRVPTAGPTLGMQRVCVCVRRPIKHRFCLWWFAGLEERSGEVPRLCGQQLGAWCVGGIQLPEQAVGSKALWSAAAER
jgi:hypothetical protein